MRSFPGKFFVNILAILLIAGFGYYYRDNATRLVRELLNRVQPCRWPITYSIVGLDPQFGLTQSQLLSDIKKAEAVWEAPIGRQLFEYFPTGDLKISLVYDNRQKATDALRPLGIVINDDRATYDAVLAKYKSLSASYNTEKANITTLVERYNTDKSAYDQAVSYWNKRGGAPKTEYNALEQQRSDLNDQAAAINRANNSLNQLADTVNSTAIVLNRLISELNLQVKTYNTVGASNGKEFTEGEYVSNTSGTAINIFQFDDEDKLVRVLAHEFGHALGLVHIDNPKAVMYYLNEGVNGTLTTDDLAALKKVCGIE